MKLSAWLKQNDLTQKDFCERAQKNFIDGTFSGHALSKWCAGKRIPRPKEMAQILLLTGGDVQPNDFYGL
tara:strand:- start:262 stop:471 length:210 start_codon:yes stop_codon:yes gene_type:complete